MFLFLVGFTFAINSQTKFNNLYYGNYLKSTEAQTFIGVIDDLPIEKEKFYKCSVKLLELKTDSTYKTVKGQTICYIKKSAIKKQYPIG